MSGEEGGSPCVVYWLVLPKGHVQEWALLGGGGLQPLCMTCVSVVTALQQMAGWGYQQMPQDGKGWRVL